MEKITGKEAVANIRYLVRMLHREWERTGRTTARVCMDVTEQKAAGARIAEEIQEMQCQLEAEGTTFRQCMELSRENYILLRLAGKVRKAGEKVGRTKGGGPLAVEMDKEEYRLFSTLMGMQE